jgi:hypothetical protein
MTSSPKVHGRNIVGYATHHSNGDVGIACGPLEWHGGYHLVKVNGTKVKVPTMVISMTSASTGFTRWVATHNLHI